MTNYSLRARMMILILAPMMRRAINAPISVR
ncbi:Uncharacterised protein [Citrobacter koseri]|nr:Uncharacterised protein [Citrobacter koseri]SQB62070.1 Uncharacterised protein [Citrobacter koseri]